MVIDDIMTLKDKRGGVESRSTVLIVSDDAFWLRYRDALSVWYDVYCVKNLNVCLPDDNIDAVVCDVTALDSQASENICLAVKSSGRFGNVPLILINENVSSDIRTACLKGGADAYVDDVRSVETLYYQIENLLSLRSAPFSVKGRRSEFKARIDRILEAQLSDLTFSVDSLAEQMNMSPTNFYRKFKAQMGTTPNNYILEFRMSKAARLICEGMYISEASMMLGYTSSSYFAKCFKKVTGMTPKDYMKTHIS